MIKKKRYTHGLLQDYPSIGAINAKVAENNVNLIFAVVRDQASLYKRLSEMVEGSFVGELDDESSNIVQLVVDIYRTIAEKIVFATEAVPEGVGVKFFSRYFSLYSTFPVFFKYFNIYFCKTLSIHYLL